MPKQSSSTSIPDPFNSEPVRERHPLTVYISNQFYFSFVAGTLGRTKGAFSAFVNQLIHKAYVESVKRNIPTIWEPGNEERLIILLADCNFTPRPNVEAPPKRTRTRRANLATPVDHAQPDGSGHVGEGTASSNPTNPHPVRTAGNPLK